MEREERIVALSRERGEGSLEADESLRGPFPWLLSHLVILGAVNNKSLR